MNLYEHEIISKLVLDLQSGGDEQVVNSLKELDRNQHLAIYDILTNLLDLIP